jgi:branched-chain amino acid transport system ATP-binding protein
MSNIQFTWKKKGKRTKKPLLSIQNLTVRVGIRTIIKNLSLTAYIGDHIHVTGTNGSGKSTLFNAIVNTPPAKVSAGSIILNGINLSKLPTHERAALGITYMQQLNSLFPSLSVHENLVLALGKDAAKHFRENFTTWATELPLEQMAGTLSGGQQKKLSYAITMLRKNNQLILLDEPAAGVQHGEIMMKSGQYSDSSCILEIEHS